MTTLTPTQVTVKPDGSCVLHVGDSLRYTWHPALRRWLRCAYDPQGRPLAPAWADPDPAHLRRHQHLLPAGCLPPVVGEPRAY